MDWAFKIQKIKEQLNLKTVDLAKAANMSPQSITDLEKGRIKNPSALFIKGLIMNLEINPRWLFADEGNMLLSRSAEVLENERLTREVDRLKEMEQKKSLTIEDALPIFRELSGLTNEERDKILAYIKSLKG